MINQIPINRGGLHYTLYIGTDEDGEAVEYIDRLEPNENNEMLLVRYEPYSTLIQRGEKGKVAFILTKHRKIFITENGKRDSGPDEILIMRTKKSDINFFMATMGMAIMMSDVNGLFKATLGFDKYSVFETSGANAGKVLVWTPEQEAEPPTFKYNTLEATPVDLPTIQ